MCKTSLCLSLSTASQTWLFHSLQGNIYYSHRIFDCTYPQLTDVCNAIFISFYFYLFSAEPNPPKTTVTKLTKGEEKVEWKWTPWDRIDINQPTLTISQLMEFVETSYAAELTMLSAGVSILYSAFGNKKKNNERKDMSLKAVYESITKKEVPASQKYLVFEVILSDIDSGDELEVPYMRLQLR